MGGFHPTTLPDECQVHADSILLGDAEGTWPAALADLEKGQLQPRYHCGEFAAADISFDYSIFRHWRYRLIGLVQFGRGCRYACDFCSIHAFYGSDLLQRPVDAVIADLRKLKQKLLFFVDDNLFADEARAAELFQALIPLKKRWVCQISMDIAQKPELLSLMRQSGCIMVLIGFESLNPGTLREIGKAANLESGDYSQVIRNIYAAGLMIFGTFVIGYDHDTKETAAEMLDFAVRNQFAVANFNPLMPMPATRLYDRLTREGRLAFAKWWIDDDYHYGDALLEPAGMSRQELVQSCREARFAFNSPRIMIQRLKGQSINKKTWLNLLVFLLVGWISRREIHFKQGRKLGRQPLDKREV